jgi:hypothetical protein
MKTKRISGVATLCVLGSCLAVAQDRGGKKEKGPPPQMSFFVTSEGGGKGADLGGLAGADALCQRLAGASGQPGAGSKTWHAYLSTQGAGAVNARDRIGNGPWYNAKGQQIAASVAELHGDTVELGRVGNRINKVSTLDEKATCIKVSEIRRTSMMFSRARSPMAAHSPTTPTTLVIIGRAVPPGPRCSVTWTGSEGRTLLGIQCIPARVAANRI